MCLLVEITTPKQALWRTVVKRVVPSRPSMLRRSTDLHFSFGYILNRSRRGITSGNTHRKEQTLPSTTPTARPVERISTDPSSSSSTASPGEEQQIDHRTLGNQQGLFSHTVFSPGCPIFLPAGTLIFNRLVEFLRRQYVHYGFQEVITPTMYKKALWKQSGHLDNYADDMYNVTPSNMPVPLPSPSPGSTTPPHQRTCADSQGDKEHDEQQQYGLKPMNCPGHCLIFAQRPRTFNELPVRYADFSALHRNEPSGSLSGLTRVRRFHQDDGHIFCRPDQVEQEIGACLNFVHIVYQTLRLGRSYHMVLSTRPGQGAFIGSSAEWDHAEAALASALDAHYATFGLGEGATGRRWTINEGDGAFYGPKIDIIIEDNAGKEHQTATIQLDFQLPQRFNLSYKQQVQISPSSPEHQGESTKQQENSSAVMVGTAPNDAGEQRPVMIHRAMLGSLERMMALLMEQHGGRGGRWPLWLNPRQVVVIAVNDTLDVMAFARRVHALLLGRDIPPRTSSPAPSTTGLSCNNSNGTNSVSHVTVDHIDASVPGIPPLTRALRPSEHSGISVDLDDSARTVGAKIRDATLKGYGVKVVIGPRDVKTGTVVVDALGIPESPGQDRSKWARMQMEPGELYSFIKDAINLYY